MYRHIKQLIESGVPLNDTQKAIIMLHGRGANAQHMVALGKHLEISDMATLAPQATNHSWYPYSFLAPVEDNQPALDSALEIIDEIVSDVLSAGLTHADIYFAGFSQGACLTLEYVTRNATRYGGVIAFTGGLIGERLNADNYKGDFNQTPILLTTGDPDPHVPVARVEESKAIMESLNANIILQVYKGRPHTIIQEEIDLANENILRRSIDDK